MPKFGDKKRDDDTDPGVDDVSADPATDETADEPTDDDAGPERAAAASATDDADPVHDNPDETADPDEPDEPDSAATTFSRTYVEKLRRESAAYRERANRADELATRLHAALVEATGKLADPTDLPFDAEHLDDPAALAAAIDDLLAGKPHLASRRPFGDVGQGNRGATAEPVDLAALLRARA